MNRQTEKRLLLTETFPAFANELRHLLIEKGELELAARVSSLEIFERCRCGDDFCATFYTQRKPEGSFGPSHRNLALKPAEGMLILDAVAEEIACVEVLDRKDIRDLLRALLP
jgi:hypothetical protein